MSADQTPQPKPQGWRIPLVAVAGWAAALGLLFAYVNVAYADPSPAQAEVIRIVLALAAAGVAATLPGFLQVSSSGFKFTVTAMGALAVFVVVYFVRPSQFVKQDIVTSYIMCTGEYERECGFQHDLYRYCYENPTTWAAANCKSFNVTALNSHDGNKCGYSHYEITCRKAAP
jgi:hypothetical protein